MAPDLRSPVPVLFQSNAPKTRPGIWLGMYDNSGLITCPAFAKKYNYSDSIYRRTNQNVWPLPLTLEGMFDEPIPDFLKG